MVSLSSFHSPYPFSFHCLALLLLSGNVIDGSETAWCYLHGIGTKKNVKLAARYYRMAEKAGVKSVGLSWIWKEKYDEKVEDLGVRRAATDESPGQGTPKKGKKLFGRKNTA